MGGGDEIVNCLSSHKLPVESCRVLCFEKIDIPQLFCLGLAQCQRLPGTKFSQKNPLTFERSALKVHVLQCESVSERVCVCECVSVSVDSQEPVGSSGRRLLSLSLCDHNDVISTGC